MGEAMDFTWSIPSSDLRQILEDVYNHVMTPDELIEWLYLTSRRTYYAVDASTGDTVQIPEEVHFELRKQNEDASLFNELEQHDEDE